MGDVVILKHVISEHMLWIKFMGTSHEITLRWMPQNPIDKSTLVQVMAWLTPEVIKPLPKPVLTKIPQCHMVALDHNMLTWSVKDLSSHFFDLFRYVIIQVLSFFDRWWV